jgi:hypothetical protein
VRLQGVQPFRMSRSRTGRTATVRPGPSRSRTRSSPFSVIAGSVFPELTGVRSGRRTRFELLNKELKHRCRVGIFPTEWLSSGSVLIGVHEKWIASERGYFSKNSMSNLYPERGDGDAATGELDPSR